MGGSGAPGGDGAGGGGEGPGDSGGGFGDGGTRPGDGGGADGGGVGGGGSAFPTVDFAGGGGGFGGGGGTGASGAAGGDGGFGGGGGYGPGGGGLGGFGGGTATSAAGGGGGAGMGGAIFTMDGALTIADSTLAQNSAIPGTDTVPSHAQGLGGAVFNLSGSVAVTNSTLADNLAANDGSSLYNLVYDSALPRSAAMTLTDTIVSGSGAGDASSAKPPATVGGPNLGTAALDLSHSDLVRSFRPVGLGTVVGTPLSTDPRLGPSAANGGPTQTLALAAGSPAIDAGRGGCLSTDQRGEPRPDAGERACDLGAYETQEPRLTALRLSPASFAAARHGPSAVTPSGVISAPR